MQQHGSSLLIGYLYFIQGVVLSLPATIILTYSKIPEYSVLSLFSAAWLPFSFKFVSAPFIETYTNLEYGRRKTWIILSCLICSGILFWLSFYTDEEHMFLMAISLFFAVFFISLEDISTDALAVKELKNPERASFLQASMQQVGSIIGSLVFMKLISKDFGVSLGLSDALMTVPQYFRLVCLMLLIPTALIHFRYVQEHLEEERHLHTHSLFEVFAKYKVFLDLKNKICRQALVFLLYLQGISFFASSYEVELMKGGFSKETLTLIRNIVMLPVLISTYIFSNKIDSSVDKSSLIQKFLILRLLAQLFGFFYNPDHSITVAFYLLILDILMIGNYIIDCNTINSFPASALSGMYITMLNSSRNLGTSQTLQLSIIGKLGYTYSCFIGFGYTLAVCLMYRRICGWVEKGKPLGMESVPEEDGIKHT